MAIVTCPSCFQSFEIPAPPLEETPCRVDYDCEVCCRPMEVLFSPGEDGEVTAEALGTD